MEIKNKQSILKLPLLLLIGVVLFSLGVNAATAASVPTDNSTIHVDNTQGNDIWDGQSATYNSTSGPKKTINNATGTVTTNGTIYIASGIYKESKIKITTNMTIIGENQQNTIINAQDYGDIFDITPGTSLTLINLTLENGYNSLTSGGAINDDNGIGIYSDLNITNCTFTYNIANNWGGAIYAYDVNLNINNSTFTGNSAYSNGGVLSYGDDGAGTVSLTINNSNFTKNSARYGGAIYNTGTLSETNNTFNNNTATYGGAIYNQYNLTITNDTFNNNNAYSGGAIDNDGNLAIIDSKLLNNTATYGGAIYNGYDGIANVNFCWIIGNSASYGTQILNSGGTIDATDNWWGTNTPNTSGNDIVGYGTFNYDPWIILRIIASSPVQSGVSSKITADLTHDSNSNDTSGQGAIPDGLLIQFYDTLGNVIGTGTTSNGKTEINYTPNNYSGIATVNATANNANVSNYIDVSNLNIYVSTTGNDITGDGSQGNPYKTIKQGFSYVSPEGTLHIANGIYTANNIQIKNDMTITGQNQQNTIINGNNLGNIFIIVNGISVKINNLTLTNGSSNKGGAIYNQGNLTINNAELTYNFAYNGGAIYNEYDGILTEISDTFTNNTAKYFGGAIFNMNIVTETNNTFTNNTANYNGGAIYNAGTFTVDNSTFKDNNAQSGGAIYNNNYLTITNSTLSNNTALNGGAFYNYDATLNVIRNTITNNTATSEGSAIYNCNNGRAGTVNSVVEFNRIIGNISSNSEIYSTDDSVNANLNWWGSNSNPSGFVNSNVNITSWLVLSANANPITIPNNSNATINVDLQHDNMGNLESSSIPDGVSVNYMPTLGSMPISSIIVDGKTQSSLYSGVKSGVDIISVIVDNQLVKTVVTIEDTIPSTVDITSPLDKTYVHGTVPINVTATDNVGVTKVVFTINGNSYTDTNGTDGWSYNWNTVGLNGVYNITATAYDAANNTKNKTIVVNVDNIIPSVSVNIKGGLYKSNQTITLKMSKAGNIYYTLNGTTPTSKSKLYTKPITISSTSTLKYIAIDAASNISSTYVQNYVIDKTAPKVVSTIPSNNAKGVSLTSVITIKFNEKINKGTNFSKIYIKNMTTGKITHTTTTLSGNIIKIKMTRSRLSLDNYQVYIPTSAVKDVAGNNNKQYMITFKTSRY